MDDLPAGTEAERAPVDGAPAVKLDLHEEANRSEVERALRSLPGVVAARLVPGYERPVDELHVVTAPGKSPKQIARDVQTLLFARFGVDADHKVISVVQVREASDGFRAPRVAIARVQAVQEGFTARVTVTVSDGEDEHTGEGEGPASSAGRRRAVARATLDAVRPLMSTNGRAARSVEIEGVSVEEVLGRLVAITLVHFNSARGDITVCGSALVTGDEAAAVARSVLDALNRDLESGNVR